MDRLPDSILLNIFSKLYYNELCVISRVCQRWRILANDFTLKKSIIIKTFLQEHHLTHLIRNHFTKNLEEFQLLNTECSTPPDNALVPITKSSLWQMSTRSKKLKKLVLVSCSLLNVCVKDLPSDILHLSIRDSELSPSVFFESKPHLSIPHLTCLDLGGCNNFLTSQDLHVLTAFKSLKALYFEGCFRINTGGIESLCEILPQLEILDVEGTDISNEGMHIILDNCVKVKELYIGHTFINDRALYKCHEDAVPNLTYLCIRETNISSIALHTFLMHPPKNPSITVKADFQCSNSCFNQPNFQHPRNPVSLKCMHYLSHQCSR